MSNPPRRGKFQPTEGPPEPTRLTIDEFVQFKKLFEDSPLAKYVIMAGVGGVMLTAIEIIRGIIDLVRYIRSL
ncbi:MAG TPA: hypothetical protein VIX11_02995 [Candidatus Acidoferrum sp.]